jgi:hypothetical protein
MSSIFDDLFDKFFNRRKTKKKPPEKEVLKPNTDFVNKLMKSIKDMENFEKNFGPATKVEYYEKDGVYYRREIWKIDGGEMVHVVGQTHPFKEEAPKLSIEEQLAIAIENEDYEEAAILRDKINLINK